MRTKKRPLKSLALGESREIKRLRYDADKRMVFISSKSRRGRKTEIALRGANLDRVIVWLQEAYLFDERP